MRVYLLILLLSLGFTKAVFADSFDQLLKQVKQQSHQELAEDAERLQRFKNDKTRQQQLLQKAQARLQQLTTASNALQTQVSDNEALLETRETDLQRKVGDLGELFGAIRQAAGELQADFSQSMVSVEKNGRADFLDRLAQSQSLPDIKELEQLWVLMLEEMGELGKTREFTTEVIKRDGSSESQQVVRVGSYSAVSQGDFLRYSTEANALSELAVQPASRYQSTANNFSGNTDDLVKVMIDPTRGQLLDMLTLKPSVAERIYQGGVIGYIILGLGVVGLLIALIRYGYLTIIDRRIAQQAKNLDQLADTNPLGRVALRYQQQSGKPLDEQEVALTEAMLKEIPVIERFNGMIKLLAAVSPLLGLLGTVIGMIITFQTITLFGTSDPKLMAGGISTALVTTMLGLSVAIPLLFAHTFISAKSKKIIDFIEHQSVGLIARNS